MKRPMGKREMRELANRLARAAERLASAAEQLRGRQTVDLQSSSAIQAVDRVEAFAVRANAAVELK